MGQMKDLTGQQFGRLTAISYTKISNGGAVWFCRCICGNELRVRSHTLISGNTKSCGCLQKDMTSVATATHKKTNTPEFLAWMNMRRRCYYPKNNKYKNYGDRGIIVCDRWRESFENFFEDMGLKPSPEHSLDRFPDNDGNYEPGNCRWGTDEQQAKNRRNNHWIEYREKKMILTDWAKQFGISSQSLTGYIKNNSFEKAYYRYNKKNNRNLFVMNIN